MPRKASHLFTFKNTDMIMFLSEHELARILLVLLVTIFLTEVVLHYLFKSLLSWAHPLINPNEKDYHWLGLLSVSGIAASFGVTQFGIMGFGMTYSVTYYLSALLLTLYFISQKNLPGVKLEIFLIVAGLIFAFFFRGEPMKNDLTGGNIMWYGIVWTSTIALFGATFFVVTRLGWDNNLQRLSLKISEGTRTVIGVVGTCAIVTGFIMSQATHPALRLEPGFAFSALCGFGSLGWAVILAAKRLVHNLSLEAVFIIYGFIGMGAALFSYF